MSFVIDNFFDDPELERAKALVSEFKDTEHNGMTYGGICQVQDDASFSKIQSALSLADASSKECFYRRYLPGQESVDFIHNDSLIGTFSAIAFLNSPEQCNGGLAFWRHKLLGWDQHPNAQQCTAMGLLDKDPWFQRVFEDGHREELWEMTDYVPMKFNRCVVFYSPTFHSRYPKEAIGSEAADCRLIKTFFYKL